MSRWLGLCLLVLGVLTVAPAAWADGPPEYAAQGGYGVGTPDGSLHYVAVGYGERTALETVTADGIVNPMWLKGSWGIPMVTYNTPAGLSHDGRTLFLQSVTYGSPTSFLVVDAHKLLVRDRFTLRGNFSFDALSPDARRLYLIQRVDANDFSRYIVRAYDVPTHRLLPGRIADRTQKSWVMSGFSSSRATSPGGRWVYTFYANPGGYPFIHALDTVRGVAHCIGIPWTSQDQAPLYSNIVLALRGNTLAVHWRSGKPWLNVDTRTWRVSPAGGGAFPWRWLGTGLAGAAAVVVVLFLLLARRRRPEGTLLARAA